MMSYDSWLEEPYQELEEKQVSFEEFCMERYRETFTDMADGEWPEYKEWVSDHYNELEEAWKNEN